MVDPGPMGSLASWHDFEDDPLPGWACRAGTLFDVAPARLAQPPAGLNVAICSVPYDTTASTRIGARSGPAAIREASLAYASRASSCGPVDLLSLRTGQHLRPSTRALADFGDLHVYSSSPERQNSATRAEVMHLGSHAECVIILGGEHSISFPAMAGIMEAQRRKAPQRRVAYLHVDHHFDFGEESVLHGRYYHGSNARRVSELPGMHPSVMAFVGMGDLTIAEQYRRMLVEGFTIRTMRDVRARGFAACLEEACRALLAAADSLYVSIDIDVCDAATASGTGNVTIGGIGSADFLAIADVLRPLPVVALDLVEINAQLDPAGVTAHLAARLLFELLLLEASPAQP